MSRRLKIPLISVAVILGLLLLSMLIVPWQIKKQGSNWIAENTDRSLTIERVYFNPFTLTVEISGTKLTEQNSDRTFIAFKRLMLSGSIRSIFDRAVIFDQIELDDSFINIELLGNQKFNFSDFTRLGSNKPEPVSTEPKKTWNIRVNNFDLQKLKLQLTDAGLAKKPQVIIPCLNFHVENFSYPGSEKSPFSLDAKVGEEGSIKIAGTVAHTPLQLQPRMGKDF